MKETERPLHPAMEFHVSREARERYGFDDALFSLSGNVVLADFRATRAFAAKMNAARDLAAQPDRAVLAGELNALGLVDEILHYVAALYREQRDPRAMAEALAALDARLGKAGVDATLAAFVDHYPPTAVYRGEIDPAAYLAGSTEGTPNREVALEELLLLWLANVNPAADGFRELFDDARLEGSAYEEIVDGVRIFFEARPPFGPDEQPLVALLRSPAIAVPDSLAGQLRYIRERWGLLIGRFLDRLTISLDVLAEDERARWLRFHGAGGGGREVSVADFRGQELEAERYSMDRDWMPRLVLIAKSTYVWLDQLSKRYRRPIDRLDLVPDEELDTLARWGFSGLWLIGLWERSLASRRVKQLRGNPEAVASAYSLLDYRIAEDLGGEAAYASLRDRAWRRGIRLASDMVPNHMGVDSRWVMEHPEWFLSVDEPPFPAYSFNGPDLSSDERVGIFIEDHYYDDTDAAVVFKRLDRWTGGVAYIYHGNDGTSMPWNDTAQLDYLRADVREAVIQTILEVARRFPVIRFDAAMTLAKRHVQRLWFPEPGSGGAIPSRAEHGMTKAQFDAAMPVEFWREVVDRVAAEVPDTLLLAEAFWLMEGYFVRTLGMHRVYNSAFMNMLRDEKNAEYRLVMKNTLEFDPEILKRYVNFMNNPDERTAVDQFGKEDKYFGVATMMATLPGLPMFGHGQVEGFTEKYGMEYRRAYLEEQPDPWLVARHEREVFPLLHRRHLFAEVRDFLLYDVFDPAGHVNEDVFAYSNRSGGERSLVVHHNRYAEARGWIRTSVAYSVRGADESSRSLVQRTLGQGLGLTDDATCYLLFRDLASGQEFIRNCHDLHERGLYVELGAYAHHVFLDLREVRDDEAGHYGQLAAELNGRGVPSLDDAMRSLLLRPVQAPFRGVVNAEVFRRLLAARRDAAIHPTLDPADAPFLDEVTAATADMLGAAGRMVGAAVDVEDATREVRSRLEVILALPGLRRGGFTTSETPGAGTAAPPATVPAPGTGLGMIAARVPPAAPSPGAAAWALREGFPDDLGTWSTLLGWAFVHDLGLAADAAPAGPQSRAWLDEWRLGSIVADVLRELGLDEDGVRRAGETLAALVALPRTWEIADPADPGFSPAKDPRGLVRAAAVGAAWFADADASRYLRVNRWEGATWFDRDAFERLLRWSFLLDVVVLEGDPGLADGDVALRVEEAYRLALALQEASAASGYRVDRFPQVAGGA